MKEQYAMFSERLNRLGNGDRAALRRSAGTMLENADGRALTVFYRCLPQGVPVGQEEKWFAVACLRCLWDAGEEGITTLPEMLGVLRNREELSDSLEHRIEILMDTPWDRDGYMLKKLFRLVVLVRQKAGTETLNFLALLRDLQGWNREDQIIQRNWARTIFGVKTKQEGETEHAD